MFTSLSQFYNSKEWKTFRQGLIEERTNKVDGILYCELTNKPIIKNYDCVAHHIKPLTMQNVNNYDISLNPENVMIVCQEAHNEIHARFGYVAERKVYYVYGSPFSGKTTFVNNIKGNSDIVVDVDNIWMALTGSYTKFEKPDALKQNVFAVRDCLMDMIKTRAGRWERAWIIEGGAVKYERERKIDILGAEPIFIDTDKETCLKRACEGCNDLKTQEKWIGFINKWFEDYKE